MPVPKRLDRRIFLANTIAFASALQLQRAAFALGFAPHADLCKLNAEQEAGPFYVPDELLRPNIAESKPGFPLLLRIAVMDSRTCKPLPNAAVDLWHCDALGLYSGYTAQNGMGGPGGPGGPPPGFDPQHAGPPPGGTPPQGGFGPPPQRKPTDHLTFLRGIQLTAADGSVNFQTIFPGFYMGRTNHIHFKVHIDGKVDARTYAAGYIAHTGQLFFPEDQTSKLMQLEPYFSHKIHRTVPAEDNVFTHQHGDLSMASLHYVDAADPSRGLRAELIAAVDPTATPAAIEIGAPSGPGAPPPQS